MDTWITPILVGLLAFLGTWLGRAYDRRLQTAQAKKVTAEADSIDANTLLMVKTVYKGIIEDLTARLVVVEQEQVVMRDTNFTLVENLNLRIASLEEIIKALRKEIAELNKQIRGLGHVPGEGTANASPPIVEETT